MGAGSEKLRHGAQASVGGDSGSFGFGDADGDDAVEALSSGLQREATGAEFVG